MIMATVPENLEKILQARYGEEVRGAIHDSIQSIYDYTADDHIDNSVMGIATNLYAGNGVLGLGTIDATIIDSIRHYGSVEFGKYIGNDGIIRSDIGEKYGVVSDYVPLDISTDIDGVYIITASRKYRTRVLGVYDVEKKPLGVYDDHEEFINSPAGGPNVPQKFDNWFVSKAGIILKYPNAKYVRFGSYSDNFGAVPLKLEVSETTQNNRIAFWLKHLDDSLSDLINDRWSVGEQILSKDEFTVSGKFISYSGFLRTDSNSACTDLISLDGFPDVFHVKLGMGYDTRAIHAYDYYGNHLGSYDHWDIFKNIGHVEVVDTFVYKAKLRALYPETQFVRFCNYSPALDLDSVSVDSAITKTVNGLATGNVLYGKKYVVCGDSFSASIGSNNGHPYGKFIADRNDMEYVNLAIAGTTMSTDVESNNFCQYRYKDVPKDADYITLCYGLNEESRIPDHIGTKESTELDTLWGAWNFSLEYLITNMPYAKIGIIIADAWTSQTMHDTLVEIAKWWGIPYLDLKEDPQVPMGLEGRLPSGSVSSKAQALRQTAFAASDNHPNEKAHEYRSTIIENFLRSL